VSSPSPAPHGRARAAAAILIAALATLVSSSTALAAGGNYAFVDGSSADRAQVRAALDASRFDWGVVPVQIQIHFVSGIGSYATPGHLWLDPALLRAGVFSWAVVQDEYAHQVDFFVLNDAQRAVLNDVLGARVWCHADRPGLAHAAYGCERFSSSLVWSYWPSTANAYRPLTAGAEATLAPWRFRYVLGGMLDPSSVQLDARGNSLLDP
jgi:hypothetical protein